MPLPPPQGKQREVVALRPEGHVVVLGTAGSGKTTMAIHRSAFLADPRAQHHGLTLLVTFNRTLVTYLEHLRPPQLARVDVKTYHQFARGYLHSQRLLEGRAIVTPYERQSLITQAVAAIAKTNPGHPLFARPTQLFVEEITWMSQHGIDSEVEYVRSERIGRLKPASSAITDR